MCGMVKKMENDEKTVQVPNTSVGLCQQSENITKQDKARLMFRGYAYYEKVMDLIGKLSRYYL